MNDARKFLWSLPLGLLLAFVLYVGLFWWQLGAPTESSRWCHELFQRKTAIAAGMPGPRLVLLGGSATLFGLNAAQVERATGLPTLNLGTHAALWPSYIFSAARKLLRPGDTVVLVPEYELFGWGEGTQNVWSDPLLLDYLVARDPAYFRALPLAERFEILMTLPFNRLKKGLQSRIAGPPNRRTSAVYDASHLNGHGDQTGHGPASGMVKPANVNRVNPAFLARIGTETRGQRELREFCEWARAHDVRVLAAFPPLAHRPEYDTAAAAEAEAGVLAFYRRLGVPVVGTPRAALYPPGDFLDTYYHLLEPAAARHTANFIRELQPTLQGAGHDQEMTAKPNANAGPTASEPSPP